MENNFGSLELARLERNCHWLIAAMTGVVFGWIVFVMARTFFSSPDEIYVISASLVICIMSVLYFGAQSSSVVLELSVPPALVKTRVWLGRYHRETRTPLNSIAWVRVIYVDDCLLSVEAGTHSHETTSMVCIPYSAENIPVAERLCAAISDALHVVNKGFLASSV